ncbi:MAG: hypothetical protein U0841_13940 [Chloroflexia bacterium]
MLSSEVESLPPSWMIGAICGTRSPQAPPRSPCSRAATQCRFPCTVLISPLWASNRKGCDSVQVGAVLVL